MDADVVSDTELNEAELVAKASSNGEINTELGTASEVLTRVELELACASEKLVNLSVLMMHVASKESDFEAFPPATGDMSDDLMEKTFEFDLLSGFVDSEVDEVDSFMKNLQSDTTKVRYMISPYKNLGDACKSMKEKLRDSEISLEQSQDQVLEIKAQCAKFHRILSFIGREAYRDGDEQPKVLDDGRISNSSEKINMQTADQQRHILRMLEKSLAREIDLEKQLTESKDIEEQLKHKFISSEQEMFFIEEEVVDVYERCFSAENASELFMGISKELLGRLQTLQLSLNGSIQRESDSRSKLEKSLEQLETKEKTLMELNSGVKHDDLLVQTDRLKASLTEAEEKLTHANSKALTLREKVSSLEKQLNESDFKNRESATPEVTEMKNVIEDYKEKLSKSESRAEDAESKYKLLEQSITNLNEELGRLKDISEKVDLLERQLKESDLRLQHAEVSAEASLEKQNMLYATIGDMENLIQDLKSKVSKAENRADVAEDKCIILSESNAALNEELSFLRSRLESLEASLSHAEEAKVATAKDIGFRSKIITDLVMQLAIERERLHKQISLLAMENKILVVKLQRIGKDYSAITNLRDKSENESSFQQGESPTPVADSEVEKSPKNASPGEPKETNPDQATDVECARSIDAGLLNWKHVLMALLVLMISAAAYSLLTQSMRFHA